MSSTRATELRQQLAEASNALRESHASMLAVISEMRDANIAEAAGYSSVNMMVRDIARVDLQQVSQWVADWEAVAEVVTPPGALPSP